MANINIGATDESVILAPDGGLANIPTVAISYTDALLLREYKKFLQRHGLREALYCNECWTKERHDGCEAFVTQTAIMIKCRCRNRFHRGQSF